MQEKTLRLYRAGPERYNRGNTKEDAAMLKGKTILLGVTGGIAAEGAVEKGNHGLH